MLSITYISAEAESFSEAALTELLHLCRERNRRAGVTGLLLHRSGSFIQTIEGDDHVVQALFEKIHADRRHRQVTELARTPISNRLFPQWSMGFQRLSPEVGLEGFEDLLQHRDPAAFAASGQAVHRLHALFRKIASQ